MSRAVPASVQWSFRLWIAAISAGIVETVLVLVDSWTSRSYGDGLGTRAGLWLIVFAATLILAGAMRRGSQVARLVLTLIIGGIGTLALVIEPISWLVEGTPQGAFENAGVLSILFALSRGVHVAAVVGAVALMFVPGARDHFRAVVGAHSAQDQRLVRQFPAHAGVVPSDKSETP
ncbi:hypothetical protein [Actinopolymorpha alba]|uniref:hypothetical protein n=1 Tax=Actinopolymorpha alba TaxID=533267 RepID=UPI000363329A|nr:hypothetical protein [Actinopolymorpha alba]